MDEDILEMYSEDEYDIEGILIDLSNNNFSQDNIEDYRHENIVKASIINGQHKQAKELARKFGLNYDLILKS